MSSSNNLLTQLSPSASDKAAIINDLLAAVSPAALFGRRAHSGLQWSFYGGNLQVDGTAVAIPNSFVTLTAASVNYIEADRAGVVSANTVGFTAGRMPLYTATTTGAQITSWTDYRVFARLNAQTRGIAMADANRVLTAAEAACDALSFSGALTAGRNVVYPAVPGVYVVNNATTQTLTFKTAAGTGVAVAAGVKALISCDGTDFMKIGASDATAGTGATTFLALTDTPSAYTGAANWTVCVNSAGTALVFRAPQQLVVNAGKAGNFTLAGSEAGQFIPVSALANVTCANDATIPNGSSWKICQTGASNVTFVAGSGVTLRYRTGMTPRVSAQYGVATVTKLQDTEYAIDGDLA